MQWVNTEALTELLERVAGSTESDFYRTKYSGKAVDVTHFEELPLLTREDLVTTPPEKRLYVPQNKIRFVSFTSGTSAREPLVTFFSDVVDYHFEPSLGLPVRRPLIIYPPLNKNFGHTFIQQCEQADVPVSPMFADFQNLAGSAKIAKATGCDYFFATPTIASLFAPLAREQGIADQIKLLALCSETLTVARRAELAAAFPQAKIANLYASSEIGQFVMFPCAQMLEEGRSDFHLLTEALAAAELIDGELVLTYGLNHASPLIRYRTGDYFEEVEPCACGLKGPVLRWSHRDEVDRVRINGVEFQVEEADNAFTSIAELQRPQYQVHFSNDGAGVAIRVEIADPLLLRDTERAGELSAIVERELPNAWKISASATLRTALERGLFTKFEVTIVPNLSVTGLKTRRFINHVR